MPDPKVIELTSEIKVPPFSSWYRGDREACIKEFAERHGRTPEVVYHADTWYIPLTESEFANGNLVKK